MAAPRLVLASQSPRRREILSALGFDLSIRPANVPESLFPSEDPFDAAERLARLKAACVGASAAPEELVVAADTIVVLDHEALGKPANRNEAGEMLRKLSGRRHEVVTGIALVWEGRGFSGRDITGVAFAELTESEIEAYVETAEPYDKAGGYALQGLAALFIDRIEGSPSNVIGFPVRLFHQLLGQAGMAAPFLRVPQ